mgnify:CR=1 FL=1
MGTHMEYSYEIMLVAVKAVVEEGEASRDIMARYSVTNALTFQTWRRKYRAHGEEGLKLKPK